MDAQDQAEMELARDAAVEPHGVTWLSQPSALRQLVQELSMELVETHKLLGQALVSTAAADPCGAVQLGVEQQLRGLRAQALMQRAVGLGA